MRTRMTHMANTCRESESFTIRQRKDNLVNELSRLCLPLRHDSRLCSSFIYGQLGDDWDVHRVVHECATMHWLYTYTLYPYRMREAYLYFSTILTSGRSVHDFIKHNVQPHIKGQTILQHGGIPSHWPWLPQTEKESQDLTLAQEEESQDLIMTQEEESQDLTLTEEEESHKKKPQQKEHGEIPEQSKSRPDEWLVLDS